MKFGVVVRRDKLEVLKLVYRVYDFFKVSGFDVVVDEDIYRYFGEFSEDDVFFLEEFDVDIIVVIGGDGMIFCVEYKIKKEILILGINMGIFGFLMEVEFYEIFFVLSRVIEGDYYIDERIKLRMFFDGEN